eukprot:g11513.t1
MTDFAGWERKAKQLVADCDKEEEAQKTASNAQLGIDENEVNGPPVAAAKQQLKDLKTISDDRRELIDKINNKEITLCNVVENRFPPKELPEVLAQSDAAPDEEDGIVVEEINASGADVAVAPPRHQNKATPSNKPALVSRRGDADHGCFYERSDESEDRKWIEITKVEKGVRLVDCQASTFRFTGKTWKVFLQRCKNCSFIFDGEIATSSVEVWDSAECEFDFRVPVQSIQMDGCRELKLDYAQEELFKYVISHNCSHVEYCFSGKKYEEERIQPAAGGGAAAGEDDASREKQDLLYQWLTALVPDPVAKNKSRLVSTVVQRDAEKEFPTFFGGEKPAAAGAAASTVAAPGAAPGGEQSEEEKKALALKKKGEGNAAFKTNDFMQAAALYTLSLEAFLDPVVLSNRAQCWLKVGEFGKAIADTEKATELDPGNSKAWFRQGMAHHGRAATDVDDKMKKKTPSQSLSKKDAETDFQKALQCLGKAEKLDPKNKQITDAIGMVSLKMRRTLMAGS